LIKVVILPATVAIDTARDNAAVIAATVGGIPSAAIYCRRNQAGAFWIVYANGQGFWASYAPLSFREFMELCSGQEVKFRDGAEFARWAAYVGEGTEKPQ